MWCSTECWDCEDKTCEHYRSKQDLYFENKKLTNNWNELEEWLKEETKLVDELPDTLEHSDYTDVLDKMEEIEEGRGENG